MIATKNFLVPLLLIKAIEQTYIIQSFSMPSRRGSASKNVSSWSNGLSWIQYSSCNNACSLTFNLIRGITQSCSLNSHHRSCSSWSSTWTDLNGQLSPNMLSKHRLRIRLVTTPIKSIRLLHHQTQSMSIIPLHHQTQSKSIRPLHHQALSNL